MIDPTIALAARQSAVRQVVDAVDQLGRDMGIGGHLNMAFRPPSGIPPELAALLAKLGAPVEKKGES
ncbi:hypothetical protein GG804_25625 [Sphingomonas histidinilytica]|uniref:hypothetical protein n=1 Tax=Rhizorhabdus histidinilytica TaxID=439228 RepID=UPI001ADA9CF1|nr:hypothetical protein [Rhizorhabdus histidinilytica]MBO9380152.1 hypothetical protein [Rhizorhabdus histidinilytica]